MKAKLIGSLPHMEKTETDRTDLNLFDCEARTHELERLLK
jgi:hypothetical protein